MDIRNQRSIDTVASKLVSYRLQIFRITFCRHGKPDDFASGLIQASALIDSGGGIHGMGIGHRFHPDRLVPTQRYRTETDLSGETAAVVIHEKRIIGL
jgi:hypothetical protein